MATETDVYKALLDSVHAFRSNRAQPIPLSFPNVEFKQTTFPYLDFQDFRSDANMQGTGELRKIEGVMMITVIAERNTGVIKSKEIVSEILDFYPKGAGFEAPGVDDLRVVIHKQANERPPIYEGTEMRIPITIPYQTSRR